MGERISQEVVEVIQDADPNARVSQVTAEVIQDANGNVRVSQLPVEVIQDAQGNVRISQQTIEAIQNAFPGVRISQLIIEAVGIFIEVPVPLVYPKLPGKSPKVDWATEFFNLDTQKAPNGAQVDLGLADTPLHTFTLNYNFMRDDFGFREEMLFRGFFGAMRGNLIRFQFPFEKDFQVKRQKIGTTDGSTRIYTLTRTYGVGEASWSEPIGYVDKTQPFNLYLGTTWQDPRDYTIDTTIPAKQQVIFGGVPTGGQDIFVDMNYNYYCKFEDPKLTLSQFLRMISSGEGIVLQSCRPGA